MNTVLVYRGEGAGWRSVKSTCENVERLLLTGPLRRFVKRVKVDTLSTKDLLDGSWTQQAALLVMPGGADLPYCKHLNGRGNRIIKEFVLSGGAYLGLCAGAYYGCARVVFEPGTPLEVVGDRELAFFPGVARGAAFPGFDYLTEAGAVAAQVEFCVPAELATAPHQPAQGPPAAAPPPQIAAAAAGSPLSFTGGPQQHHATAYDYCNGGPYFTALDGSPDVDQIPGVTLLASYCHVPTAAAAAAVDRQPGAGQAGPAQEPSGNSQQQQQQQQQQRGQQEGFVRRAAAVQCAVGQGVAVLCGTHPELGPHWLDPCGESNAAQGPQPHTPQPQTGQQAAADTMGNDTTPPSQQMQETQTALGGRQVVLAQETALGPRADPAAAAAGAQQLGDSSSPEQEMPVVCRDIALAAHAQQLRRELQAWQGERDLLLSSLLFAALVRG